MAAGQDLLRILLQCKLVQLRLLNKPFQQLFGAGVVLDRLLNHLNKLIPLLQLLGLDLLNHQLVHFITSQL